MVAEGNLGFIPQTAVHTVGSHYLTNTSAIVRIAQKENTQVKYNYHKAVPSYFVWRNYNEARVGVGKYCENSERGFLWPKRKRGHTHSHTQTHR